jgi:hypothetical protein
METDMVKHGVGVDHDMVVRFGNKKIVVDMN